MAAPGVIGTGGRVGSRSAKKGAAHAPAVRRYRVEQSTALARDCVQESASDLVAGSPEVTSGEVRVRAER